MEVKRWAFMHKSHVLRGPDGIYLTRWRLLSTPYFGVFLHKFEGPDLYPTLHDHPWSFLSIVLRGGYIECTDYRGPKRVVTRFNRKSATQLHWIDRLLRIPTWTLILHGPRRRTWGFVDPDGTWVQYDQHPSHLQTV